MDERQIASGIAAPQCGNYDDALVAAKTRAALGCSDSGMVPKSMIKAKQYIGA
jgi:hypothetical protein